uniref:Uncharacterized protein n=1 Tax=Arundo donax TaxID=35708 RepID=A0A0A9BMT6_ARUDO
MDRTNNIANHVDISSSTRATSYRDYFAIGR